MQKAARHAVRQTAAELCRISPALFLPYSIYTRAEYSSQANILHVRGTRVSPDGISRRIAVTRRNWAGQREVRVYAISVSRYAAVSIESAKQREARSWGV